MSSQKPTPDYNGIPSELHENVFSFLNVLDRSIMRQVSTADEELANKQPYSINTVDVFAGDADPVAKVSVQDTTGAQYDVIPLSHFAELLKNPQVEIGRLTLFGGKSAFGENFRRLLESVRQVSRSSVRLKELVFSSEIYVKRIEKDGKLVTVTLAFTDTTRVLEIRRFLELFVPNHLEKIRVETLFSEELWMEIVRTEQWRNARTIEIERGLNMTLRLFDTWDGMHLVVRIQERREEWTQFVNRLDLIFRHKPIGASFLCNFLTLANPRLNLIALRKVDTAADPTKRLYSFRGLYFSRGFVQPHDGTPVGFELAAPNEQRHFLWANP